MTRQGGKRFNWALAALAVALFGAFAPLDVSAAAGINQVIPLQGKVVNANGTNVTDGTYDFVLKLYDGAASGSSALFTETWSAAALWSSTMSSAPISGAESLTYATDTNESTIKVGQVLTNTTKSESVVVVAVNTGTNVITISPTRQAWANGDTVTNKLYVKDGVFSVGLNSLNADLSGVDFNTDTIFLGINFNADGEMKPRIQYGAAPYAFNARKVAGLTVTDTTGTFTLAAGKTLTVNNTITFSGTDSTVLTLPGASDTLVGLAASQTLTNKTLTSPVVGGALTLNGATSGTIAFQAAATSSNVTFTLPAGDGTSGYYLQTNGTGTLGWAAGSAGAPTDATYLTLGTNATLSGERVLTGTANQITLTDAGANGNLTLSLPQDINLLASAQFSRLGLGGSAGTAYGLAVSPSLSGTIQTGISSTPTFTSSATQSGYSLYIAPATQAASFTLTDMYGLYLADASKGAGSTITTQYGLKIADMTSGATNYSLYTGTAQSYFGGNVGIKTAAGSELDVKGTLRLSGATSGYVGFAPAAAAGSTTYTLPSADGVANAALITNASGTLSWSQAIGTASTPQFGNLGLGSSATTNVGLYVSGSPVTGTGQIGVDSAVTFTSSATSYASSFYSYPITQAASFTVASLYGMYMADATKGSGSAITTQYGLYIADLAAGSTNYGIYVAGADDNYFAGEIGIGATSPTTQLHLANKDLSLSYPNMGQTVGNIHISPVATGVTNAITFGADGYENNAQSGIYSYNSGNGTSLILGTSNSYSNGAYARVAVRYDGNLGIGTTDPTYKLHVVGNGYISTTLNVGGTIQTTNGLIYGIFNAPTGEAIWGSNTATSGNPIGVRGAAAISAGYDFRAAGSGVDYGAFTGSHEAKYDSSVDTGSVKLGMIVSSTGVTPGQMVDTDGEQHLSLSDTLPVVKPSAIENDPKIFGVIVTKSTTLVSSHWYEPFKGPDDKFTLVNALGEGRMLVTNYAGNVQVGDLVTSSPIAGYGMKQADDVTHSYTVGKATETINWDSVTDTVEYNGQTYKFYLVAVTYTSG